MLYQATPCSFFSEEKKQKDNTKNRIFTDRARHLIVFPSRWSFTLVQNRTFYVIQQGEHTKLMTFPFLTRPLQPLGLRRRHTHLSMSYLAHPSCRIGYEIMMRPVFNLYLFFSSCAAGLVYWEMHSYSYPSLDSYVSDIEGLPITNLWFCHLD